jgi:hypothetical protein
MPRNQQEVVNVQSLFYKKRFPGHELLGAIIDINLPAAAEFPSTVDEVDAEFGVDVLERVEGDCCRTGLGLVMSDNPRFNIAHILEHWTAKSAHVRALKTGEESDIEVIGIMANEIEGEKDGPFVIVFRATSGDPEVCFNLGEVFWEQKARMEAIFEDIKER